MSRHGRNGVLQITNAKSRNYSFFLLTFDRLSFNANSEDSNSSFGSRLSQLLVWICVSIEGIVPTIDFDVPLEDGSSPLHHAAQSFSYDLTIFLLGNGVQTHAQVPWLASTQCSSRITKLSF
ncbi:uncharacterized protein LOC132276570 [Cornus florida]|uniref:uncharacterized protein LOC132276570 n=1 Tax=Cornus florida TaxID=4283 RepID=UPI00289F2827|nr:uncharacterized protein LOC132276570 [Cornus florida]